MSSNQPLPTANLEQPSQNEESLYDTAEIKEDVQFPRTSIISKMAGFAIIFIGLWLVLLYFKLFYILTAINATLAFFIAIVILINKKHLVFYSIALLITIIGCMFLSSSIIDSYIAALLYGSNMQNYDIKITLSQISSGLSSAGLALTSITTGVFFLRMNKSAIKIGHSKYTPILFFLYGIWMIIMAINSFLRAFQSLQKRSVF